MPRTALKTVLTVSPRIPLRSLSTVQANVLWLVRKYGRGTTMKPKYLQMQYRKWFGSVSMQTLYNAAYKLRQADLLKPFDPSYKRKT